MTTPSIMTAQPDGGVASMTPVLLPIMAPRLQGDFHPEGTMALTLWGAGKLATISFSPITGPFVYARVMRTQADEAEGCPPSVRDGLAACGERGHSSKGV